MSTIIQLRRGSATEASNLLGFEGELFIDLDNKQLRYHDGTRLGGHIIGRNANTLSGFGITDAYTKTEVYTKSEVTDLISGNFNGIPATSIGVDGDLEGNVAVDNTYFYVCTADYDGVTDIWKRITLDAGTW